MHFHWKCIRFLSAIFHFAAFFGQEDQKTIEIQLIAQLGDGKNICAAAVKEEEIPIFQNKNLLDPLVADFCSGVGCDLREFLLIKDHMGGGVVEPFSVFLQFFQLPLNAPGHDLSQKDQIKQ